MVIALRMSNQSLLSDTAPEKEWGFGQTFAPVTFVSTLLECPKGVEGMKSVGLSSILYDQDPAS